MSVGFAEGTSGAEPIGNFAGFGWQSHLPACSIGCDALQLEGISMRAFDRALLAALLCIGLAASASSQGAKQSKPRSDGGRMLTGKERLGQKWTDEQRIDNCNVPVDKRGTKPRPSACSQTATGF